MYDVVIVGAGPAGVAAASRCVGAGLKTLVLDKRNFPRRKVCDALMGPIALGMIEGEFGEIPAAVLADPPYVEAVETIVHGFGVCRFEQTIPLVWRKDLDHWMVQQLKSNGVEVWEGHQFVGLSKIDGHYRLRVAAGDEEKLIEANFVIGADGAVSRVRGAICPDLPFRLLSQGMDCWEGEIDLSDDVYREFFDPQAGGLLGFSLHRKDSLITVSYAAERGELAQVVKWTRELLEGSYGLRIEGDPVWEGRCMSTDMAGELASGKFVPAQGNVLLVGDAGGFMLPVGEGIGPSFKSGLLAGDSILAAHESGEDADQVYFENLEPMLLAFGKAHEVENGAFEAAEAGGEALFEHLNATRGRDFHLDY
jgi:flavin-dependent dehydrogenase